MTDDVTTTMTITLPGVDRADPRVGDLALAALDVFPEGSVTATTGPADWTEGDMSALFVHLEGAVERVIRDNAPELIAGHADTVAARILSELAHRHGMAPVGNVTAVDA